MMIPEEKLEKAKKLVEDSNWSLSNTADLLKVPIGDLDRALREKYPWIKFTRTKRDKAGIQNGGSPSYGD